MNKNRKIELVFLLIIISLGIFDIYLASKTAFLGEDEATYTSLGIEFSKLLFRPFTNGGKYSLEPTFMPLLYSSLFLVFGESLSLAKMITAFFGLLTLVIVYLIGRKINIYVGIFSVAVLLLIEIFTHMSLLAYVDVPIAFFSALSLYFIADLDSRKKSIVLGVIMGISYYVKVSAFFIVMIFTLYFISFYIFKRDKKQLKLSLLALVISILVIAPYIIRNVLSYGYPFFIVLDILFPAKSFASGWIGPGASATSPLLSLDYFVSTFGWIPLILAIFGSLYIFFNRGKNPKQIDLSILLFLIFLLMFLVLYSLGKVIAEQRYLMIIFPQFALVGGYFLEKLREKNKYLVVLLVPLIILSLYTSVSIGLATSESTRYPQDYIQALEWVKNNTPKDALVFTTYSGSVINYAQRDDIWVEIKEFDKIMTTDNTTYIHDILKQYNVSYVVIWRSVVAQSYYIPNANLAGVFSYQFVRTVMSNNTDFTITYQNQNNAVLKVN